MFEGISSLIERLAFGQRIDQMPGPVHFNFYRCAISRDND